MPTEKENIDSWEACSPGELSKMVHRVDARQRGMRRMRILKTTLASTGVFACVVLALGLFTSPNSNYGGISCSYCRGHMAEYAPYVSGALVSDKRVSGERISGKLGSGKLGSGELVQENATFVTNMKTHLEKCTFCRGDFNELYPDLQITTTTTIITQPELTFSTRPLFAISQ